MKFPVKVTFCHGGERFTQSWMEESWAIQHLYSLRVENLPGEWRVDFNHHMQRKEWMEAITIYYGVNTVGDTMKMRHYVSPPIVLPFVQVELKLSD